MTKKEISNIIGSAGFWLLAGGVIGFLVAEYTGIGGGLASLAEPFSPARNQLARNYAVFGSVLGAVIGGVVGHLKSKKSEKE